MLTLPDIALEFRKYSEDHPLREMTYKCLDNKGNILKDSLIHNSWALNSITAVCRPLQLLEGIDKRAYDDMIHNKLKAKRKGSYDLHNLISAFCELSVINTFVCRSSDPKSFVYEDRPRKDSNKNVEFSIKMSDYLFHVEVKTSDLILEDKQIAELLKKYPAVLLTDAQTDNYEQICEESEIPVRGSLARRLADFLESANDKFGKTTDEKEINLLIICWDDRIQQPLMALKSTKGQGLLTTNSFIKDAGGNSKEYDNIDCILVNSNYSLFKEYILGILFNRFTPSTPIDPFFQGFTYNYIIDRHLTEDRVLMIKSIIQQNATIVDEKYADTLRPTSIATMKDEQTIKFR